MGRNDSTFDSLIKLIDRNKFDQLVEKYQSDYYVKSFGSWEQLVTMLYGQLTNQQSLRMLIQNVNELSIKSTHTIKRSTLSDANSKRPAELYIEYSNHLLSEYSTTRQNKSDISEVIRLIDSTPIRLSGRGHDWVEETRRIKGLKVHVIYDSRSAVPIYFTITSAKVNDIVEGQKLTLEKGATYIFDRAYYDFKWWAQFSEEDCTFVTRPKNTLAYKVKERFSKSAEKIISDWKIQLTSKKGQKKYSSPLRLIKARVTIKNKKKIITIITNDFHKSAEKIADLYRERWEIELFFKWIKQHLKLKKFYGENENAIKIQICIAIIAYILIAQLKQELDITIPMHNLCCWIQTHYHKNIRKSLLLKPPQDNYNNYFWEAA